MATKTTTGKGAGTQAKTAAKRSPRRTEAERLATPERKVCVTAQAYPSEERALKEVWKARGRPESGFGRWLLAEAFEAQRLRLELEAERSKPAPIGGGLGFDLDALERGLVDALGQRMERVLFRAQTESADNVLRGVASIAEGIAAAVSDRVLPDVRETRLIVSKALGISQ